MQHIGFFIENCIKWAENHYLGYSIFRQGNYYPNTRKNHLCSILLQTCSIQVQNAAYWIFLWLLVQIDWKSLFGLFWNRKGWLLSKIPKKTSAAAYCCIIAAYRIKMQHIGFFIENCIKWNKNHFLGHFLIKENKYYPKYPKKLPQLQTAVMAKNAAYLIF